VAGETHPFDALLLSYAESVQEWQRLRDLPRSEAAAWVAQRRVTPSG